MNDKRRFQGPLSERSATLADPSRIMRETLERLADLDDATVALGEGLVAAGLPRRAWRSEQATLRLLSDALPAITLGAFLARLEAFAARNGPDWLRGTHDDREAFHAEVGVLSEVARPLLGAARRLQRTPPAAGRRGAGHSGSLERALRHPRLEAPLATIAETLSGFEARAPLMRAMQAVQPLPPAHPDAHARVPQAPRVPDLSDLAPHVASDPRPAAPTAAGGPRIDGSQASQLSEVGEVGPPAARLRAKVAAFTAKIRPARSGVPTWPVWLVGLRQRLSASGRRLRGRRLAASAVLVLAVVVAGTLLALSHRTLTSSVSTSLASVSSPAAALTALAGSSTATAPETGAPTAAPAPSATAQPALKLALSCALHGATATLTLKNVGTSSFTWQAEPPPSLTAAPAQGTLAVGQSAVVQVSAKNKKTATGTIRVIASHDNQSTEDRVSCR
ncbi:MAG TPA: hypothetical protein VGP82_11845 [Ktedonobacterales bacterium]|jgi:hypothetical protein|nr:hypothetical protein [Ktedonobacterales bacterium]